MAEASEDQEMQEVQKPVEETTVQPQSENDIPEDDNAFIADQRRRGNAASGVFKYGAEGKEHRHVSLMNAAPTEDNVGRLRRETAIPLPFVIGHVSHEIESTELTTDLLVFIPFLILFLLFFLLGQGTEANYFVLKGVRDGMFMTEYPKVESTLEAFRDQVLKQQRIFIELDKRYKDMLNTADWADYVTDVVIPSTWDCLNSTANHQLLAPLGQDYHIGAMRFRTQQMRNDSCKIQSDIYPDSSDKFPYTCYGPHKRSKEEKVSPRCNKTNPVTAEPMFIYEDCPPDFAWGLSAIQGVYHCGGYSFTIPFNFSCADALSVFGQTDAPCPFADNWATRVIIIEWFFYTPATDMWHGVKLYVETLAGGGWWPQYMFRSFRVWTPKETNDLIIVSLFIIYVLYYWVFFFVDMVRFYRKSKEETGEGHLAGFFTEFWNILELANLVTFLVIFVLRFLWLAKSRDALDSLKFPASSVYPIHLDNIMAVYAMQVYCNAVNTILTFLKLLKYVRLNERLGVLGRTIANCQQSIFGVLVLFVFIVLSFGITGWSLFGINLSDYRSLGVSMSSLMRILTGEIDYESMRRENRFLAGAFFWCYVVLALFLLLNFIIAIITNSFEDVSGKAFSQDFDEVLLRWGQHLRLYLRGSNICRIFKATYCPGHRSERKLLEVVLENLKAAEKREIEVRRADLRQRIEDRRVAGEKIDELMLAEAEEKITVMMMRDDWNTWIQPDVYEELTDLFFDYTWDDLMNEFDDARKSSEEVEKRQMMETVKSGVEKIVSDDLRKIEQLDEMLTQIEKEAVRLREFLKGMQA